MRKAPRVTAVWVLIRLKFAVKEPKRRNTVTYEAQNCGEMRPSSVEWRIFRVRRYTGSSLIRRAHIAKGSSNPSIVFFPLGSLRFPMASVTGLTSFMS
jgi:hypothetical protein